MSDEDDNSLWQRFTRDINPLRKRPAAPKAPKDEKKKKPAVPAKPAERIMIEPGLKPIGAPAPATPPQLDGRTETKLKRGQLRIEATLDLHGMTQARAHAALRDFVMAAQASGKRCVLVITGKGNSKKSSDAWFDGVEGVLKQQFPVWLAEAPLNRLVLKHMPAQPKHGGGGAFYVYLKRDR